MIRRVLVYHENYDVPEYGEMSGFRWKHSPVNWLPVAGGNLLSHDILEHFAGDKGSIHEELMALGSSINIRGMSGLIKPWGYASDIEPLIRYVAVLPGKTRPLDKFVEFFISEILSEPDLVRHYSPELLEVIRGWLRIGYRRSVRRFGDNHRMLTQMFQDLNRAFYEKTRKCVFHEDQKLHVSVDVAHYSANVTIKNRWAWM